MKTVEFADNRIAQSVFGAMDAHLTLLEKLSGTEIRRQGNRLLIYGDSAAAAAIEHMLRRFYRETSGGHAPDIADVEAAWRMRGISGADEPRGGAAVKTKRGTVHPRTARQSEYLQAIAEHDVTFGLGPAGTGKTFLAAAAGAAALSEGRVERLILTRPAVEAGERLGFLPGDLKEKVDPYLRPLYDALNELMPPEKIQRGLENGTIEAAPLAFMRGRTFKNAFAVLDEAQNCTPMQIKMFLTRLGEGSRMVICGDPSQSDLPAGTASGLADAVRIIGGIDGVAAVRFEAGDVVRHPLTAKIVAAYEHAARGVAGSAESQ